MHLELINVSKAYAHKGAVHHAVRGVKWQASGGEIFGLLGPNGAGKTSMIRMILDILRPDAGQILIDGDSAYNRSGMFRRRVGYLPEERGLYKKRTVLEMLLFFAALKGMKSQDAKRRARELLENFAVAEWEKKYIDDLSKGMAQKVQIISCLLHDPDLVILDEPFSGLDPVNMRVVRSMIQSLKQQGKLVCLSTHMMAEVEALCDRIFMIHQGAEVLYGSVREIMQRYAEHDVMLDPAAQPEGLNCVESLEVLPAGKCVHLREGCSVHDLLAEIAAKRRSVSRFEVGTVPLEEIFIRLVRHQEARRD